MSTPTRLVARLGLCCLLAASPLLLTGAEPRFFADDPLPREPETQDASKVQEWDIDLVYRSRHQSVRPTWRPGG